MLHKAIKRQNMLFVCCMTTLLAISKFTFNPLSCSDKAPPSLGSETPRTNFFSFFGRFVEMKFRKSSVGIPSEMEFAFVNASTADLKGKKAARLLKPIIRNYRVI